jgi:hypothetical protein
LLGRGVAPVFVVNIEGNRLPHGEYSAMPHHPLAEVFGYPTNNFSPEAQKCRAECLCPFKERKENGDLQRCTKDKKDDPLGVCSVFNTGGERVITCPTRFQQEWRIVQDAAGFFFPVGAVSERVTEMRLTDQDGKSVGSIDVVLFSKDAQGRINDYGSVEVQAVYISGNIRRAFENYMTDPAKRHDMDWRRELNYPRPDFLSSSRKRLAPQLISKGGILNAWGRKMAVVLDTNFYSTLPTLEEADKSEADIAWLVYDLIPEPAQNRNLLTLQKTVYTKFESALMTITQFEAGDETLFIERLHKKIQDARTAKNDDALPTETIDPNL